MFMKSKLYKFLIILSVTLLCLPTLAQAQRDLTYRYYSLAEDRSFAHWSYSLNIGGTIFDGDILEEYDQLVPSTKFKPTIGGTLERSFNPVFGFGLQYKYIPYKADPKNTSYRLEGTAHEATAFMSVNLLNLFYQTRKQRWSIYGNVGWGLSFYEAELINTTTGQTMPDPNVTSGVMKLTDGMGYVIPLGLQVECNISRTFALGLSAEYRMHSKDNYEGSPANVRKGNSNDAFTVVSLGIRHKLHFGKEKGKHTRTSTYAELIPMKDNRKEIEALEEQIEELKDMIKAMPSAEACCKSAMDKISDLETMLIERTKVQPAVQPVERKQKPTDDSQEKIKKAFNLALRGVQFETDKAIIKTVSYSILDNIAEIMHENPAFELDIVGHTDNVGSAEYNLDLSERRAYAVRQYLINKRIDGSRLTSAGEGLTKPIATNATAEGRTQNRRVEFVVRQGDEIIYSTDKDLFDEEEDSAGTSRTTGEILFDFDPADYEMTDVVAAKGTRLALFSTQHYGSYMFWPYIYLANMDVLSPDPNALVVGTKLAIPKLPAEMIDVDNPEAVERVNQIKEQLLGQ